MQAAPTGPGEEAVTAAASSAPSSSKDVGGTPSLLEQPVLRIRPRGRWLALNLGEVWGRRELLGFLLWRDVLVRYRQSALGVGWAVLQPLISMIVFTFVFHRVAGIEVEGVPYAVFSFTGLLPWLLFQTALTRSSESMINYAGVLTKVYFPRLLVPLSTLASACVDFLVAFGVLLVLLALYGVPFTWRLLLFPAFMLYAALAAFSVGLWLTALYVRYRDVGQLLPFIVRIAMFVSPVAYPLTTLTAKAGPVTRWLLLCNPMAAVLEGFRWSVLGTGAMDLPSMATGAVSVLVLLIGGLYYFRSVERTMADVL